MKSKKTRITPPILLLLALWVPFFLIGIDKQTQAGPLYLPRLPDKGVYHLFVNGELTLACDFTWEVNGSYQSEIKFGMTSAKQLTLSVSMEVDEGQWAGFQLKNKQFSLKITRENNAAVISNGKTRTLPLKPGTIPYALRNPALINLVLEAYDEAKGGLQVFSILRIGLNQLSESGVGRLNQSIWTVKGKPLKLTCYLMDDPGGLSYI